LGRADRYIDQGKFNPEEEIKDEDNHEDLLFYKRQSENFPSLVNEERKTTQNPNDFLSCILDDLLDEEFQTIQMKSPLSEKPRHENTRNLSQLIIDSSQDDPDKFYKTFKEVQRHESLLRENSFNQLCQDRPQSAEVKREEKGINTSKEERKQTCSDKVNDLVNCPICLDMIENATETPCCNNIFCELCIIRTTVCPI